MESDNTKNNGLQPESENSTQNGESGDSPDLLQIIE